MCKQWALCVVSREIWYQVYFHLIVLQGLLKDEEERQAENSLPHFRVSSNIIFVIQMLVNYLLAVGETPSEMLWETSRQPQQRNSTKIIKHLLISLRFVCVFYVWYWCKWNSQVQRSICGARCHSVCCTEENTALYGTHYDSTLSD